MMSKLHTWLFHLSYPQLAYSVPLLPELFSHFIDVFSDLGPTVQRRGTDDVFEQFRMFVQIGLKQE